MWKSQLGAFVITQLQTIFFWTREVVLEVQRNRQDILKAELAISVGLDMRSQKGRKVVNNSKVKIS